MSVSSRVRLLVLILLLMTQFVVVGAVLWLTHLGTAWYQQATIAAIVSLALGASQAVVLASHITLGHARWWAALLEAAALLIFHVACYAGIHQEATPISEWLSFVAWWIAMPLVVGAALGVAARRRGWRWVDRDAPRGPNLRWSVRGSLGLVVLLAVALGVVRWLNASALDRQ